MINEVSEDPGLGAILSGDTEKGAIEALDDGAIAALYGQALAKHSPG